MSRCYFGHEEANYKRMLAMQQELADCKFHAEPCPLLHTQIVDAMVFAKRFLAQAQIVKDVLEGKT